MITEQDLQEYNKWLMEVWNPNQLYIPFAIDAPKAFLDHRSKIKKLSKADVSGQLPELFRNFIRTHHLTSKWEDYLKDNEGNLR